MYRQDEPEVNLEQILERIRSFFRRIPFGGSGGDGIALAIIGLFVFIAAIWLSTGFYTVQPGERAALRRLGAFEGTQGSGLHWFWPAPIGTRNIVAVDEVRRLELGLRGATAVPTESLMITGDENIVDVQLAVQYDIKKSDTDIEQFLFHVVDPDGETLKDATETALRQVVGSRNIDDVLTTEKEAVQDETEQLLQSLLDNYGTGINIIEVRLLNVRPPAEVQDAFDDVVRAREDKDRTINLAEAYQEDILPRANGDAARLREAAEAFKAEQVARATGQASRFVAILNEYRKAPDVTRQRLFLEAMENILPGVTKFIVDSQSGQGNLLQFLPLTGSSPVPASGQQPQSSGNP
ncbi:MAG: FtsH protease activity modulator HflK [Chloroflexi bacterium]|nr:FtsH protease activity modulator HflK [Chloroflexota bacterium]